jgi:hypothetical protein
LPTNFSISETYQLNTLNNIPHLHQPSHPTKPIRTEDSIHELAYITRGKVWELAALAPGIVGRGEYGE